MVQFLSIDEVSSLLGWRRNKVMLALKSGTLTGKKLTIDGKTMWSVVHPGLEFIEYVTNPEDRCQHIPMISTAEVASICGLTKHTVRFHVSKGHLKPAIHKNGSIALFTPFAVRQFMKKHQHKDIRKRKAVVLEDVIAWFYRIQGVQELDSYQLVEAERRDAERLPEPERSLRMAQLEKLMIEAHAIIKGAPAPPALPPL